MKNSFILLFTSIIFASCTQTEEKQFVAIDNIIPKTIALSEEQQKNWQYKDIIDDTIPGISLDKAYTEIIKDKKGAPIIIAVIDTKLDINHEDISKHIWINPKEIPDNNIDDDNNGYIDDMNGWNFLGNKKGEDVFYSNFESMRIIRKYDSVFSDKKPDQIPTELSEAYALYKKAQHLREKELKKGLQNQKYGDFLVNTYPESLATLQKIYPKQDYTLNELDSLYTVYKKDTVVSKLIYYMVNYKKYNLTQKRIHNYKKSFDAVMSKSLRYEHNERTLIGDDPENINDIKYGNPKVWNDDIPFQHAIGVAGAIAADRHNDKGINGILDHVKIMSLCVASSGGDEHDKDIALAIRYAADNGAKIINMSFGKPLSLNRSWVDDAIVYAESKDVLIVCSAGNDNIEINLENTHYPNDYSKTGEEISNNLIKVGASTYSLDKTLKAYFSNYSKKHIDLFAPGYKVYSTSHGNIYRPINGTSLSAPIVSGVAALIRSYHPDLSAFEVKDILMKSGVSYDIDVEIIQEDGSEKLVPFSELSKSGKIVNAYNALLMAEQVANSK